MHVDVPLVFSAFLGFASAAGIAQPRDARHPPSKQAAEIKSLENQIAQLENALRTAFSDLANLYNGHIPSTTSVARSSSHHTSPASTPALTTSVTITTTSNPQAVSSSIASLQSSLASASSSLSLAFSSSFGPSSVSTSIDSSIQTVIPVPSSQTTSTTSSVSSTASVLSTSPAPSTSSISSASSTSPISSTSSIGSTTLVSSTFKRSTTFLPGTATTASSTPSASANATANANITMAASSCATLCDSLIFPSTLHAHPVSCVPYAANSTITIQGGQNTATCGSTITPAIDLCRVVLTITTSSASEVYMEVWLPDGSSTWNGRTMSTDNSGVNGCVAFSDMNYVTGLGFAAIGDNGGHNSSSFDGSWFSGSNELVLDWAGRARHASVVAGKLVVEQFYLSAPAYSYYIGCSAGGWQGMKSAQDYPLDFDGIIAGSPAADFNHLQAWSGRFVQMTGSNSSDPRFLTLAQWTTVQSAVFDQCDAALDGVSDGILEDPTICQFDSSVLTNSTYGLTSTQVTTVDNVFTELYNTAGNLLFPALLYGSQVDAFRLGQLSGSIQAISEDWYKYAVLNDSTWNPLDMNQNDYVLADSLDSYHGNVSGFNADLSSFRAAGGKMMMYHGMADPLVSEGISQRYYLKVASELGLTNTGMDEFMRLYRISGMAHCSVASISGAGAWMFGQNSAASAASSNIIQTLQDWVEDGIAADYLTGTKFWYDTPSLGVEFERNHCKFPYRTTWDRSGDYTKASSWNCTLIENWQSCGVGALPRLCNVDGSFGA